MHITKVTIHDADFDENTKLWNVTLTTQIQRKVASESEPETYDYSVKSIDNNLLRALDVLDRSTERFFADLKMKEVEELTIHA